MTRREKDFATITTLEANRVLVPLSHRCEGLEGEGEEEEGKGNFAQMPQMQEYRMRTKGP